MVRAIKVNCQEFENVLLDYVDGSLESEQTALAGLHIQKCKACLASLKKERKLRHALTSFPSKTASLKFKSQLFDKVLENENKRGRNSFYSGFGVAIAASFMLWFAVVFHNSSDELQSPAAPAIVAEVNHVKNIKLAFEAPDNFKEVTLTINLPEHVELKGFSGKRTISWNTSLDSGKNILSLPVVIKAIKDAEIIAVVSSHGKSKTFRVPVSVKKEKTTFYQLNHSIS